MKDAYSFDRDEEGLERSFRLHAGAYQRIFERCGLEYYAVQAESRDDGRERVDRLPRARGLGREHARHVREGRLRRRPRGRARRSARRRVPRARSTRPEEVETPGVTTIEGLAEFLGIDPAATSKAMPVVKAGRNARARARPRRRPARARRSSPRRSASPSRPATEDEIRAAFGAEPRLARAGRLRRARSSRTRRCARASSSPARTATGWHLRGRRGRPRLRAALRRHPRAPGGRRVPALRRRAPLPGPRSRSATSSSSGRATRSRSARRYLDEDGGRAADRHGQLRHRARADHGRGGRAATRRARHRVAAVAGAVRRRGRRDRGRRPGGDERSPSAICRRARGGRARRPPRRPRPAARARSSPTPTCSGVP